MLLVWLGVSILTFFIANVVPADPVALRLGPKATPDSIQYWRHEYGLDRPLPEQYIRFMEGLLKGDLGTSIWSGRPIIKDLYDYFPATLELAVVALLLSVFTGIPVGLWAAIRTGKMVDRIIQLISTSGLALPLFWLGLVLQLLFYRRLGILPLDSRVDLVLGPPVRITGLYLVDSLLLFDFERFGNSLIHMILPAFTLSLPATGAVIRMMRASTLDVLTQDFIRAARAKGVPEKLVLFRHVVRNALLPVVTLLGNLFNALLGGVFVVEAVFSWPGLGWYATKVILASDYSSIVSITLVIAVLSTSVNLVIDILYRKLDPRIQLT